MNTMKTRLALEAIEMLRAGVDDPELHDAFKAQIDDALACACTDDRRTLQDALAGEATQASSNQPAQPASRGSVTNHQGSALMPQWLPPMNARQAAAFAARMNSKEVRAERQRKLASMRSNPAMMAMRNTVIGCPVELMDKLLTPVTGK